MEEQEKRDSSVPRLVAKQCGNDGSSDLFDSSKPTSIPARIEGKPFYRLRCFQMWRVFFFHRRLLQRALTDEFFPIDDVSNCFGCLVAVDAAKVWLIAKVCFFVEFMLCPPLVRIWRTQRLSKCSLSSSACFFVAVFFFFFSNKTSDSCLKTLSSCKA